MTKLTSKTATYGQASAAKRTIRFGGIAMALASAALLSGCINFQSVTPGMTVAEAVQKIGKPSTTCKRDDGTERLVWTTQPDGQFAWGTNTTPQGTVVGMQQLLTDKHFQVLANGRWDAQQVLCEFGEPDNKYSIAKGNEIVWSYRYLQNSVWPSIMYVFMGSQGKLVSHFHPAPDPAAIGH